MGATCPLISERASRDGQVEVGVGGNFIGQVRENLIGAGDDARQHQVAH